MKVGSPGQEGSSASCRPLAITNEAADYFKGQAEGWEEQDPITSFLEGKHPDDRAVEVSREELCEYL